MNTQRLCRAFGVLGAVLGAAGRGCPGWGPLPNASIIPQPTTLYPNLPRIRPRSPVLYPYLPWPVLISYALSARFYPNSAYCLSGSIAYPMSLYPSILFPFSVILYSILSSSLICCARSSSAFSISCSSLSIPGFFSGIFTTCSNEGIISRKLFCKRGLTTDSLPCQDRAIR